MLTRSLKLLALLVSAVLLSGAGVWADTATIIIRPGDNWVAPPLVPFDPDPASVFAACIADCALTKFDPTTEQPVSYGSAGFGNILLGDGVKVANPTSTTFVCTYEGVPDGVPDHNGVMTDMWVSLPGNQVDGQNSGGMHWVGHPFYHDTPIAACFVTNGSSLLTLEEAVTAGWIDGLWNYMDAETQTVYTAGLASLGANDTWLRATHMYEVQSHLDNLAFIVPAYVVPEPASGCTLLVGLPLLLLRRRARRGV